METRLYFGWGEKLELEVSSITFFFVLALLTDYLFCIGLFKMYVLANSRQCSFCFMLLPLVEELKHCMLP